MYKDSFHRITSFLWKHSSDPKIKDPKSQKMFKYFADNSIKCRSVKYRISCKKGIGHMTTLKFVGDLDTEKVLSDFNWYN